MDRIAEQFEGSLGDEWTTRVSRERVLWMVRWAVGPRVLDWGCSQGIATQLLLEKATDVLGFDLDARAIAFARSNYPAAQFTTEEREIRGSFNSILLGEILEHQENPRAFARKVASRLEPGGRLIITVPHGYDECRDHRHVFTLTRLLEVLEPDLYPVEVSFVDGFARAVVSREPTGWMLTREVLREAEDDLVAAQQRERVRLERASAQARTTNAALESVQQELEELRGSKAFRFVRTLKAVRRRMPV